jgi:hypothetical protein
MPARTGNAEVVVVGATVVEVVAGAFVGLVDDEAVVVEAFGAVGGSALDDGFTDDTEASGPPGDALGAGFPPHAASKEAATKQDKKHRRKDTLSTLEDLN